MTDAQILSHVDHTILAAATDAVQIETLCGEAVKYKTASVCIPPCYVRFAREMHPKLNICTVIGFPLGYDSNIAKATAASAALGEGADELDMVINITDVKNNRFEEIRNEIFLLKQLAFEKVLKVIVETCYLTDDEKKKVCQMVTDAGADYIKTSTGFGTAGATLADIELFKANIGENVKIKASGGIRTREEMVAYLEAGADRLGTSSAIKILCKK